MQGPGANFMGQEVWKYLDQLASSDPEKYKEFIRDSLKGGKDFFQSAVNNDHKLGDSDLLPKWSIRCPRAIDATQFLYINVCASSKMEAYDSGSGEVPLFMSPMVAEQVDVVVHTDVLKKADLDGWFKQDLVNLFIATLMDEHDVRVTEKKCVLQSARKSVLKKEVSEKNKSVMQNLTNLSSQAPSAEDPETEKSIWNIGASAKKDAEPQEPALQESAGAAKSPLIQEVAEPPSVTESNTHVHVDVPLTVDSAKDIDLTIKSNELRLRVEGNSQTITLPAVVRDADYTAKFVKKKRLLRLAFEKLM